MYWSNPNTRIQMRMDQGLFTFCSFFQVFVAAIRNRNLHLPQDHIELYEIDKDKEAAVKAEFLPHRDVSRFYHNL
jgi:peptide/histidine transporter 3/4